ncbi:ABC transporter permease subunit [Clostridium sp.]|uniref:ABC transporter permease subunit n=1 Tax=Clostridium sp. TaxID=1506 RepID=UPI002607800D|nr:ABC transporter permease subunit [Clostridium sp.]
MNIFKFELKRNIKSLLYWSIGTSAIIILFMSLFPSMKNMGMKELVGSKLDALPPAILEMFNFSSATDFSNINDYLGYCLQYLAMAFGIYGAILGVNSIVEEESEGTIEFLYAKPVSRSKILWSKILSIVACLYIYVIVIGAVTMGISLLVKPEDVETINLMMDIKSIFIGLAFLGYIFMAIGVFISTMLKKGKMATSIGIGIFFGTYILGIVSKLKEEFSFVKYFSPYEWVIPTNIIKNGFEMEFIIIGLIVILVTLGFANIIYRRKDLNC